MKDILVSVDAVTPDGTVRTFDVEELGLGYRTSIFTKGGYVDVYKRQVVIFFAGKFTR